MLYEVDNQKTMTSFEKRKLMEKKSELLMKTKEWWEAGQGEHEKQVWHAFDPQ
jgi:hypothetical protein